MSNDDPRQNNAGGLLFDAMTMARNAEAQVESHEALCAERYKTINESIAAIKVDIKEKFGEVKKILAWAGITMLTIIIGALSWSLQQQWAAQKSENERAAMQISLLRSQLSTLRGMPVIPVAPSASSAQQEEPNDQAPR